jgi:hypothetical protein
MSFLVSLDQEIPGCEAGTSLHDFVGDVSSLEPINDRDMSQHKHPIRRTKERDDIGGPKPLRSSWMMREREPAPPRKPQFWFAIDDGDNTVGKAYSQEDAYKMIEQERKISGKRLVIRPVIVCEETLEADSHYRKWKAQHGYD